MLKTSVSLFPESVGSQRDCLLSSNSLERDKLAEEKSALHDQLTLLGSQICELQVDTHTYTIMVEGVVTWESQLILFF